MEIMLRGVNTPGHKSKEVLEKDVDELPAHLKDVVRGERRGTGNRRGWGGRERGGEDPAMCCRGG